MHSNSTLKWVAFLDSRASISFLVVTVFVMLMSCRKDPKFPEIEEEEQLNIGNKWVKISGNLLNDVNDLAIVSNDLYIGGSFNDTVNGLKFLAKMSKSHKFSPLPISSISGIGVFAISTHATGLYVGGSFGVFDNGVTHKNLISIEGQNVVYSDLSTNSSECINGFRFISGDFLVFGRFASGGSNGALTDNSERLITNAQPTGYVSALDEITAIANHQNELYACGPNLGLVKKASNSWIPVTYLGESWNDRIFAMESNEYELMLFGKFQDGVQLKIRYQSGAWANVTEVKQVGTISARNKIVREGNNLILCGSHLHLNGKNRSNVLIFDGFEWKAIGNLKSEVRDVVFFNSKYYAATNDGIYVFED